MTCAQSINSIVIHKTITATSTAIVICHFLDMGSPSFLLSVNSVVRCENGRD